MSMRRARRGLFSDSACRRAAMVGSAEREPQTRTQCRKGRPVDLRFLRSGRLRQIVQRLTPFLPFETHEPVPRAAVGIDQDQRGNDFDIPGEGHLERRIVQERHRQSVLLRQGAISRLGLAADEEIHVLSHSAPGRLDERHDIIAGRAVVLDEADECRLRTGEGMRLPMTVLKQKRRRLGHGARFPQTGSAMKIANLRIVLVRYSSYGA